MSSRETVKNRQFIFKIYATARRKFWIPKKKMCSFSARTLGSYCKTFEMFLINQAGMVEELLYIAPKYGFELLNDNKRKHTIAF